MTYTPRTYSEYRNGQFEGANIDYKVDDNTIHSTFTPFVGNSYVDYAHAVSQYVMFLQENYNTNNPLSIRGQVPDGTIIYDNHNKEIQVVDKSNGNIVITPNTATLTSTDLIPSAHNTFDIGKEDKRWSELHINSLYTHEIHVKIGDNDYIPIEDTFKINTDDITHTGSTQQGATVSEVLNSITLNTAPPVSILYIDESVSGIFATDNNTAVYVGSIPHALTLNYVADADDLSFSFITDASTPLTVNLGDSANGTFSNGSRSIVVRGGCTVTRIITDENLWVVSGAYNDV